jgi:hypothetical protein
MILIPTGMLTGLAPDELAAVLTHELAHIRRYDHWLILVQRFLEALLFFHPAAWYLSRQVHAERERCCDDLVVAAGGDRLIYAQSLLRVAELRGAGSPRHNRLAALAADGQRPSQLRQRIARLLGDGADPHVRIRNRWPAVVLGLACAAVLWTVTASTWQLFAQNRLDKPQAIEPARRLDPTLDSSSEDDDQRAGDKQQTEFIAKLPDGIEVELAGLAEHAVVAREWRRADGGPIDPAESAELTRLWEKLPWEPRPAEHRVILRTRGLAAAAGIQLDASRAGYRNAQQSVWRKAGGGHPEEWLTCATITPFDKERRVVSISVRLTGGWGPVQAIDSHGNPLDSAPVPQELKSVYSSAKVRVDHDSNEVERLKKAMPADELSGVRISLPSDSAQGQIVAFDKDNREHSSPCSGTSTAGASGNDDAAFVVFAYFKLPLSQISRFEYKLRPYRHEVIFENVSLQPGEVTKVNIRTEAPVPAAADKDVKEALLQKTLEQIAERGTKNFQAIKTAHIKFCYSNSGGPYKPGTTPDRCRELLEKYDLVQHPDELRELINELSEDDEHGVPRPWSEYELHVAGRKIREAVQYAERAPDIHITDGQTALRWNEANSQVNIDPAAKSRVYQMGLAGFWLPFQADGPLWESALRAGGLINLSFTSLHRGTWHLGVDEASGFWLTSTHRRLTKVFDKKQWLGWKIGAGGIPYPTVVVDFSFQDGQLKAANFRIVHEMRLNIPLPETIFQMGAPAGTAIFDSRPDAFFSAGTLNREVFDVTSAEQLKEALKPLDPEPRTPQEKFAVAELQRLYALADDEVLKRIGPPYPASRKHLPLLLGTRSVSARRAVRSDVIAWKDGKLADPWTYAGGSCRFDTLVTLLLKLRLTEIEGDPALLKREIPGDFVYRAGAPVNRLAKSLAEIAGLEFQKSIRLTFRDIERPVYVAQGELKLALPAGQKEIAVNGGRHSGHQGEMISYGNLEKLLQEVATYIHVPVINEATPSSAQLAWSSRWYDLAATKPENRFKLDPPAVLKLVTEQTGIAFTSEKCTVRVLHVESGEFVDADDGR